MEEKKLGAKGQEKTIPAIKNKARQKMIGCLANFSLFPKDYNQILLRKLLKKEKKVG